MAHPADRIPERIDRAEWLKLTAGMRRHLRDEILEVYRETRGKFPAGGWSERDESPADACTRAGLPTVQEFSVRVRPLLQAA